MDALKLYDNVAAECAKRTTKAYSTSFSLGIRFLAPSLREAIYNIYGFVRYVTAQGEVSGAQQRLGGSALGPENEVTLQQLRGLPPPTRLPHLMMC